MPEPRIFFHVQHLLGIGHLRRAALLCRTLSASGFQVNLIAGGLPVPDLDVGAATVEQLPPMRIGKGGFHDLIDADGRPVDSAWKAARRDHLLALFAERRPDIVITEAFPFGRRQMRFELLPLLDAASGQNPRPLIVCSVRDILKTDRKPGRADETVELIGRYYDSVLVHGDPSLARFEETFPEARSFADKLRYTGMVTNRGGSAPPGDAPTGVVIVSAGGGAVGERLLAIALEARPLSRGAALPWRLLAGPNLGDAPFEALRSRAPEGVTVERYRRDFPALLMGCAVSVSQAGYNTVGDLLVAGARAVLVPFDDDGENEQPYRAAKLAERGLAQIVTSGDLSAGRLAAAIDRALAGPPMSTTLDLDGAARAAAILRELFDRRR